MADILAIFGILLFLGIAYPGLLTTWWLLFPNVVSRAHQRVERTPWRCLWLGLGVAFLVSIPSAILMALPFGPAKLVGWILIVLTLAFSSLGAAGLAHLMGDSLSNRMKTEISPSGAVLRGAIALELAAAFPFIGWMFVFPLSTLVSLGAATFSLLRWAPSTAKTQSAQASPAETGELQAPA